MTAWENLPIQPIPLTLLIWQSEPDPHTIRALLTNPDTTPIHVEALCNGHYYVHDGRARIMAAHYRGATHINAATLDHWAPQTTNNTPDPPSPGEGAPEAPQPADGWE